MPEVNPYEPPKTPPSKAATAKRAVGFLTLIILTPIAVVIAGAVSCAAAGNVMFAKNQTGDLCLIGLAIFLIPPMLVLIFMGWWTKRAYNRERAEYVKELKKQDWGL